MYDNAILKKKGHIILYSREYCHRININRCGADLKKLYYYMYRNMGNNYTGEIYTYII